MVLSWYICRHIDFIFTACLVILLFFVAINYDIQMSFVKHYGNRQDRFSLWGNSKESDFNIFNLRNKMQNLHESKLESGGTVLPFIPWRNRSSVRKSSQSRYQSFKPIISSLEHSKLLEIFRIFKTVCDRSNLTYVLYGGSLLGSYRHHGMIPWDDDIDVLMNETDKFRIINSFSDIRGYELCTPLNRQWKFFQNENRSYKSCSENTWPYVDIFFFSGNDTHVWDNNESYKYVYNFAKRDVFPLTSGIFESELVSIPQNIYNVLQRSYSIDLCVSSLYSHKEENVRKGKQVSLPCKRILPYFPFVYRNCENGFVCEYLRSGASVFYKVLTNKICKAVKK